MARIYSTTKVRCPICRIFVTSSVAIHHHIEVCQKLPEPEQLALESQTQTQYSLAAKYGVSDRMVRQMLRLIAKGADTSIPIYRPENEKKPAKCVRCQMLVPLGRKLCDYCIAEKRQKEGKRERTSSPV